MQGVCKQAALGVIQRDAGLVTGRFDAQYEFHDTLSMRMNKARIVRFVRVSA